MAAEMRDLFKADDNMRLASAAEGAPTFPTVGGQGVRLGRPIHRATLDGGWSERVVLSQDAPESYANFIKAMSILCCNPCGFLQAENVRRSTFVTVYENKVESNSPFVLCCCSVDQVGVMYMDRVNFDNVSKAGFCNPICMCCPTCFDLCGEGLVLRGSQFAPNQAILPGESNLTVLCCHNYKIVYPVRDAEELKRSILEARRVAMQRVAIMKGQTKGAWPASAASGAAPPVAEMARAVDTPLPSPPAADVNNVKIVQE